MAVQNHKKFTSLFIFLITGVLLYYPDYSHADSRSRKEQKKTYNIVKNTVNGVVKTSLKIVGKDILFSTKKTNSKTSISAKTAYEQSTTNIITKTINKTLSCPNSGTLTLIASEVIDKVQKAASFDGSINLNNCNAVTGSGVTSITAQVTNTGGAHSFAIPTAVFTGTKSICNGTAGIGNITLSNILINGSYNKSGYSHNSTIQGSLAITCNSLNYLSCNWASPVSLNNQSAILAGCNGIAITGSAN